LRVPRFAIAAIVALSATAAAANILVVRSTGPSAKAYPPGRSIPPNARITLRQGDALVLLDGRGTRQLRGPGTFTAGAAAQGTTRSQLTTGSGGRVGRVGAVRDLLDSGTRPPTLWHVDVSQSSTVCVADSSNILLWRPSATRTVNLTIAPTAGGASPKTVAWPAGQASIAWPVDVRIATGSEYRLSVEGVAVPTRLRFRILPAAPQGMEATASSFIQNGCQTQLDLLVDTFQLPAPAGTR
jgi:hypothetical protein